MSETADDPALGHEAPPTVPAEDVGSAAGSEGTENGAPGSAGAERDASRARDPRRLLLRVGGIALAVLLVDQLTKMWAQSALTSGAGAQPLVGDLIQLRLIYNSGAALSLGSGMTWLLTLVAVGVVVAVVVMARSVRSVPWGVALGLVLGGALGNLTDRLLRAPGFPEGHVVDFIDYGPFVGNVADIAIVLAAVGIAVLTLVGVPPDGSPRAGTEPVTEPSSTTSAEDAE